MVFFIAYPFWRHQSLIWLLRPMRRDLGSLFSSVLFLTAGSYWAQLNTIILYLLPWSIILWLELQWKSPVTVCDIPNGLSPMSHLGNSSDTLAFSEYQLSVDTSVWNSGPRVFAQALTGYGGWCTSQLQPLSSAYSLSTQHKVLMHMWDAQTEPRNMSAHPCHSCMTSHWTARTPSAKQHANWRSISGCLTISIHPYFLSSIEILLWKLDFHPFIEVVNVAVSWYTQHEQEEKSFTHKQKE